jgi:aspartate/glutamate racemase
MLSLKADGARQILLGCTDFPPEAASFDIGIPIHESTEIHVNKTLDNIFRKN